jgi:sugar phosphate permease
VGAVIGFAFMVGYYGLPFVMSLYLQQRRGLSALATGVVFLPMMLSGAVLTPFTARFTERIGARRLITGGLLLMAAGLCLLAMASPSLSVWAIGVLMIVVGVTGPMVMPPATTVLLDSVPPSQAGIASGVFNTSRQLGGALAVAVFGALLAQPTTFADGLRTSLLIAACVAVLAAAAGSLLRHSTVMPAGASGPSPYRQGAVRYDRQQSRRHPEQWHCDAGTRLRRLSDPARADG